MKFSNLQITLIRSIANPVEFNGIGMRGRNDNQAFEKGDSSRIGRYNFCTSGFRRVKAGAFINNFISDDGIERMGTGIRDMIRRCSKAGLPEPEIRLDGGFFVLTILRKKPEPGTKSAPSRDQITPQDTQQVTGQVDPWLIRALTACAVRPLSSREIQESTGLRHRETFQRNYLDQIISDGLVERTIPDKPTSRLQKYRLTQKGRELLERLDKEEGAE